MLQIIKTFIEREPTMLWILAIGCILVGYLLSRSGRTQITNNLHAESGGVAVGGDNHGNISTGASTGAGSGDKSGNAIGLIGIVVAIIGVVVAVLAWLLPKAPS